MSITQSDRATHAAAMTAINEASAPGVAKTPEKSTEPERKSSGFVCIPCKRSDHRVHLGEEIVVILTGTAEKCNGGTSSLGGLSAESARYNGYTAHAECHTGRK